MSGQNTRPVALPFVENGPVYTPGSVPKKKTGQKVWKLSSNESPIGTGTKVAEALNAAATSQHLYPDPNGQSLAEAIAAKYNLDPERILVSPGSDAIINWLVRGWVAEGDEVVYSAHGFQSYRIRSMTAGVVPVAAPEKNLRADVDALLAAVTERTRLMFVANPNNPTGTYLTPKEIQTLRNKLRSDVMLVIDEAYFEYCDRSDYESAVGLAETADDNIIVTRTFSKFYGLAGLRVGWAYAPKVSMGPLARMRGPFSVSNISISAAIAALSDEDYAAQSLAHNSKWQPWLREQLASMGYETTDGMGNFVLMQIKGGPDRAQEFVQDLREAGFFTRVADQNGLPDWVRISVGIEEANRGIVEAIRSMDPSA